MITKDISYPTSRMFKKQEGERPSSYLCKICSKKFISGRALGVHMGAHAHTPAFITVDTLTETKCWERPRASDQISIEKENNEEGLGSNGSNLMYGLRRNPKSNGWFPDYVQQQDSVVHRC